MIDPDLEDVASLKNIEFGEAFSFVMGNFPQYKVLPKNNFTDPGIYEVQVTLIDDNPAPQTTTYTFKIIIEPLPPPIIKVEIIGN